MVQLNGGSTLATASACQGPALTGLTPAPSARAISRRPTRRGRPCRSRRLDGTGVPQINDDNLNAMPRGMAIRFALAKGGFTDIVATRTTGFSWDRRRLSHS
jgi:catalase